MAQHKFEVVEEQIKTVRNAESLGETQFSRLFHEARTTTPDNNRTNGYSGVTLQVRVSDDGEFEVHDKPAKTRQGEHLIGTDAWDGKVSMPVRPFLETRVARQEIVRQLRDVKQTYLTREQHEEERQKVTGQ